MKLRYFTQFYMAYEMTSGVFKECEKCEYGPEID